MRKTGILAGCLILLAVSAVAQTCLDYSSHLRWSGRGVTGGAARGIAVADGLLLAGIDNQGLKVYTLADPDAPSYVGGFGLPGSDWHVEAAGARVVLVSGGATPQLFLIDVTDPTDPDGLGGLSLAPGVKDMALDGDRVAVLRVEEETAELLVIDLSEPTLPVLLGTASLAQDAAGVALAGDLVLVAGAATAATLYDLSDPSAPAQVGVWNGDPAAAAALTPGRAWLAGPTGLRILDVGVPAAPVSLGALDHAGDWTRLAVDGDAAWLAEPAGMTCRVDASDPAAPVISGCLGVGAADVEPDGSRIYLARGGLGVDIAEGAAAVEAVGRWALPDPSLPARALALDGATALVCVDATTPSGNPGGRLYTVSLDDPAAPGTLAELALTGVPSDVAVDGTVAVVPWYHVRTNRGGVTFVDVSDPSAPEALSTFEVFGEPTRVLWTPPWAAVGVRGSTGAIGDHLLVLHAGDPAAPVLAEQELLPYAPTGLALTGTRLFLTGGDGAVSWLDDYDYSDPAEPQVMETFGLTREFDDLAVLGDRLYALEEGGTLDLLDLSFGDFIWYRAVTWLPSAGRNLALAGRRVHVAAGDLFLADRTDPDALRPAGTFGTGTAVDVAVDDACIHLLDADGLWLLPLDCEGVTPVFARAFSARRQDGAAELSWLLSGEGEGNLEIEGSSDGRVWTLAPAGPGRAVDPTPPAGAVDYRLLLVADGVRTELASDRLPPAATATRARFLGAGPNPFNPRTTLRYVLPEPGRVRISVHTLDGARVRTLFEGEQFAGEHRLPWDGRDAAGRSLPSGAYLCRLEAGSDASTLRVTLVR